MSHAMRWAITALSAIAALVVTVSGQDYYRSGGGTVTSPVTAAVIQGGSGTTSTLTLQPTSGVGTTGADIIFGVGNNGATEAARITNGGMVGIGGAPIASVPLTIYQPTAGVDTLNVKSTNNLANVDVNLINDTNSVFFYSLFGSAVAGTRAGVNKANMALIEQEVNGPLLIQTQGNAQPVIFGVNNVEKWRIDATSGGWTSGSAKVLLKGTGTGATQLAATQTTAPTCSSNCGTSPSIAGTDTFMTVTMGATGVPASGWVVTFNGTWAAAPSCVVQMAKAGMVVGKQVLTAVTTTTTLTAVTNGTAPANGDVYHIHCGGLQ